jgi:hypothetical protein
VFPDWLIFPLESGCIDLSPEGEWYLELEKVILLLAKGFNENVRLIDLNSFVLKSCASRNIVTISILNFNQDLLEILRPLEGRPH